MKKFNVSILDYLGKYEGGVVVLLSLIYNDNYFEATYFYNEESLVFTAPEELELLLGHKIEEDPEYRELIKTIIGKVLPYNEIINRIDDIDFSKFSKDNIKEE